MPRPLAPEPEILPIGTGETPHEAQEKILQTVESIRGRVGAVIAVENPPVAPGREWTAFVRYLESLGYVVAAPTKDNPYGVYVAEVNEDGTLKGWGVSKEEVDSILITFLGRTLTTRTPEAPRNGENGLNYVHSHAMAILQKNDGDEGWTSVIAPSGELGLSISNTAAIQYAQAAFEGAVSMGRNEKGEIEVTFFRLEENARRFSKSAEALGMPPLDIDLFIETVLEVVKCNAAYIPMDDPNAKLYIRPCMFGCEGGAGACRAKRYVCTFEVFPYGDYLAGKDSGITARAIKGKHRPQSGGDKVAPNYASDFALKDRLRNKSPNRADDFLSFDEKGNAEEFSSCACFCLVKGEDGYKLRVPFVAGEEEESNDPSQKRHSLPSITRKSVIAIAGTLGIPVEKQDISFEELSTDESIVGIFTTGTAAGITRVDALQFVQKEEDEALENVREFTDPEAKKLIGRLYDILTAVRSGTVEKDPELAQNEALKALTAGWVKRMKI